MTWACYLTSLLILLGLHDWWFYTRRGHHITDDPWWTLVWEFVYVLLLVYLILEE